MPIPFADVDLSDFWADSRYARKAFIDAPYTASEVARVEQALGYRLPAAYLALMLSQNGGVPRCTAHRTSEPSGWAEDYLALTGLFSIGSTANYSLLGVRGSRFWIEHWQYPPIGIYFANTPSAGHDMLCLDYRHCGPAGEPQVVHVNQESNYHIQTVATDFETFIRGLALEPLLEWD